MRVQVLDHLLLELEVPGHADQSVSDDLLEHVAPRVGVDAQPVVIEAQRRRRNRDRLDGRPARCIRRDPPHVQAQMRDRFGASVAEPPPRSERAKRQPAPRGDLLQPGVDFPGRFGRQGRSVE